MTKYSDTFRIRNFHTGPNGLSYIPDLFHFLNETAGDHCIEEKVTVQDFQNIGLTWMLSRMNVDLVRIPEFREELTVTTWPTGARGLFSCRDFLVTDENSQEVLKATSAWLTINLERRRVVRLPKIVLDMHPDINDVERTIIDNFKGKLSEPDNGTIVSGFRADYSTLDINSHVTSPVYIRWLLDALPFDFHKSKKLVKLEINYKLEILPGIEAEVEYFIDGNEVIHCIRPAGGGPANCIAKSCWK